MVGADDRARATTTFTDTHPQPDGTADDAAGHPGLLVQRRHDHDRRQARHGEAVRVPAQVRARRGRPARACRARRPGWCCRRTNWSGSAYGSIPIGHERRRSRRCRWPPAYAAIANDGTWVQPHLVKEIDRAGRQADAPAAAAADPPGAQPGERGRAAHDAGGGGHRRRAPPAGTAAVDGLPGRRQDRHRQAGRRRPVRRRRRRARSSAWRRPTHPRYVIAVFAAHARAAPAATSPRRRSAR